MIRRTSMVKFWTVRFLPTLTAIPAKLKTTLFLMVSKPIILLTTITTTETLVGVTILPISPSMFMITVGDGAVSDGAGTTHGYGMADGDGTTHITIGDGAGTVLTTVGDGVGTTHGDLIVGAGADITAGDTLTMAGAGPDTMAGAVITTTIGTVHTMAEDIETTLI